MRAFTDSFFVSNPEQNYTISELYHCITYSVKKQKHLFTRKVIFTASKRHVGADFCGETSEQKETEKKLLQNSPN